MITPPFYSKARDSKANKGLLSHTWLTLIRIYDLGFVWFTL